MRVVGTAGHVDHGKSTLVAALTGIDPDRLKEEKAREMTIELGFAWRIYPMGKPLVIIDVPGHRYLLRILLAGVRRYGCGFLCYCGRRRDYAANHRASGHTRFAGCKIKELSL